MDVTHICVVKQKGRRALERSIAKCRDSPGMLLQIDWSKVDGGKTVKKDRACMFF